MRYDWIAPHLHPGETILWAGRPEKGPRMGRAERRMALGLLIAYTLMLAMFAAISPGGWRDILLIWAALTLTEGALLLCIALDTAVRIRSDLYVITDRRLLFLTIRRRDNGCRLRWEMNRRYITSVQLSQESERLASLWVNRTMRYAPNTLYDLPNAEAVRELLLSRSERECLR